MTLVWFNSQTHTHSAPHRTWRATVLASSKAQRCTVSCFLTWVVHYILIHPFKLLKRYCLPFGRTALHGESKLSCVI